MKIDLSPLYDLVEQGYVSLEHHPKADLLLWGPTDKAKEDYYWLPETLLCNGLITAPDGTVVERPFQKFFTFEQHVDEMGGLLPEHEPIVTELLDGETGILYKAHDGWAIASRNSFKDDVAIRGTEVLRSKYSDFNPDPSFTHMFEVIHPDLKKIVSYGDETELIFLGGVDRDSGWGVPLEEKISMPVVKRWHYASMEAMFSEKETENRAGMVMYYPEENLRLKFLFKSYSDQL